MTMSAPGSGFHRVDELPDRFRAVFPKFKLFNAVSNTLIPSNCDPCLWVMMINLNLFWGVQVQSDCFNHSYMSDQNMVNHHHLYPPLYFLGSVFGH